MAVAEVIKFTFSVAEYEALLEGLELARKADVKSLVMNSHFNFLVQKMNGEYDIRNATLKQYVDIVK